MKMPLLSFLNISIVWWSIESLWKSFGVGLWLNYILVSDVNQNFFKVNRLCFGEKDSCLNWGYFTTFWSYCHRSSCLCIWSCHWLVLWVGIAWSANWLFSLCYLRAVWVSGIPGCKCDSTVCVLRASTYSRVSGRWLVPWVGIARSVRICLWHLYFVMVLCESHELISPKLKVLHSIKDMWCVVKLILTWILTLDMIWNWVSFGFGFGFGFGFYRSLGFEGLFKWSMSMWLILKYICDW